MPDEATRALRRRLARRSQLVRARTRAKNECHAALVRRLITKPAVSDLFGVAGSRWLNELELPVEERETVDGCLRQIEFLDQEIAAVEQQVAAAALGSPEIKRLMTVPGVNVIAAATFLAAVGDVSRFATSRRLVGYLGRDPRVRQSGSTPATHGRISKQGSASARHALVEAAWSVVRQPGPLHAFYQRIRARRGHQVAVVAAARKLACLFWCMLTRGQDYAYGQPSLTKKKLRRLELAAGAPRYQGGRSVWSTNDAMRQAERARPPSRARLPAHSRRLAIDKGASATPGRASSRPSKRQAARQGNSPKPCALARRRPRPQRTIPHEVATDQAHLTFSLRESAGLGGDVRPGQLVPGLAAG
jgi:transposase